MIRQGELASAHVREFVEEKGERLLELLEERPAPGAEWYVHSHGAAIRVECEVPHLFERLVLVLVRPETRDAERFRQWAEHRLRRLGRYMEAGNSGRLVQVIPAELTVTGVVMRRLGTDPTASGAELPPLLELPGVLARFTLEVERYVAHMTDDELRYVSALRLCKVPRGRDRAPEHLLTLDALNTVVGLFSEAVPIAPVSLVRGVLGEIAEQLASRKDELEAAHSPLRPRAWLGARHRVRQLDELVPALDEVSARVDENRPDLLTIRKWLGAIKVPRWPLAAPMATTGVVLLGGLTAWLVWVF